jgi:hypothetical protein
LFENTFESVRLSQTSVKEQTIHEELILALDYTPARVESCKKIFPPPLGNGRAADSFLGRALLR